MSSTDHLLLRIVRLERSLDRARMERAQAEDAETEANLRVESALAALIRRGVITTDPSEREACCGIERDADGFCIHRPSHPIYVEVTA